MENKQLEEKLSLLDHLQSSCTGCGLCSEGCATFQLTGYEHESPRGRLNIAAQFLHGRIHPQSPALSTFDRCLGCQACEPLCPHQVPYAQVRQIVQEIRSELHPLLSSSMEQRQYKRWITLAYRIGSTFWRRYGSKWLSIPSIYFQSKGSFPKRNKRLSKDQPVLAVCCVDDLYRHDVIKETLTFMQQIGFPLALDKSQPCCGAIFERLIHGGEESVRYPQQQRKAASLQRKTLNSFLKWLPSNAYFLAKGCYNFAAKYLCTASDLYVLIENILDQKHLKLFFPKGKEVYYQPYCASEKGMNDPIWRLLNKIEGLTIRNMPNSFSCCGGFCGETLLHPEHAQQLSWEKLSFLPDNSTLIVTSPDCWGLFQRYQTEKSLTILYPIQLLARAHARNN